MLKTIIGLDNVPNKTNVIESRRFQKHITSLIQKIWLHFLYLIMSNEEDNTTSTCVVEAEAQSQFL